MHEGVLGIVVLLEAFITVEVVEILVKVPVDRQELR